MFVIVFVQISLAHTIEKKHFLTAPKYGSEWHCCILVHAPVIPTESHTHWTNWSFSQNSLHSFPTVLELRPRKDSLICKGHSGDVGECDWSRVPISINCWGRFWTTRWILASVLHLRASASSFIHGIISALSLSLSHHVVHWCVTQQDGCFVPSDCSWSQSDSWWLQRKLNQLEEVRIWQAVPALLTLFICQRINLTWEKSVLCYRWINTH